MTYVDEPGERMTAAPRTAGPNGTGPVYPVPAAKPVGPAAEGEAVGTVPEGEPVGAVADAEPVGTVPEAEPVDAVPEAEPVGAVAGAATRRVDGTAGAGPDRGYTNAAAVSGLPMTEIVYWFALALAAGADVAAFHQVVSLILRDQGDALVWLMVVGLTAIALTLAHFAGRLARDVTASYGTATWKQVFACVIPWVALGLAAFAVRLIVADSSGGTTVDGSIVGGGDVGRTARQASAAVLFLVLYVGSGAVAAFGEFLSRNPLRSAYRRALRAHHRALTRLSRSQPPYELAVQMYRQQARIRAREEANWQAAREQRLAHADELKRYAAVLIATHLQDPTVTDAMTLPDRRPLVDAPAPDARPAIEARPARGPQRSIRAATGGTELTPRHGSPALVATVTGTEDTPDDRAPLADRSRDDGRKAG